MFYWFHFKWKCPSYQNKHFLKLDSKVNKKIGRWVKKEKWWDEKGCYPPLGKDWQKIFTQE